ncbi:hypothetical protein [Nocardia brasiliensis]
MRSPRRRHEPMAERSAALQGIHADLLLMARFRRHQRDAYLYITADWSEADRLEFARLMLRYVDSLAGLKDRGLARDS